MSGLSSAVYVPQQNFGPAPTGGQQAPGSQDPQVPGTRGGQSPNTQQSPEIGVFDDKELEAFAIKPEDKDKKKDVLDYQAKAEDLQAVSQQVAQNVKVDEALMTAALRGDAASMQQMLNSFGQQVIQQALLVSTTSAAKMTNLGGERAVQYAAEHGESVANQKQALKQALEMDERFSSPKTQEHITNRIAELAEQYPTAPADVLARKAAADTIELIGKPAPKQPASSNWGNLGENNWAAEFGR